MNQAMSTVILEVEEAQEKAVLELLETLPGVRLIQDPRANSPKPDYWKLLGKYKHTRVSSERLAVTNAENKNLEGE
jgi:hypothetical protein